MCGEGTRANSAPVNPQRATRLDSLSLMTGAKLDRSNFFAVGRNPSRPHAPVPWWIRHVVEMAPPIALVVTDCTRVAFIIEYEHGGASFLLPLALVTGAVSLGERLVVKQLWFVLGDLRPALPALVALLAVAASRFISALHAADPAAARVLRAGVGRRMSSLWPRSCSPCRTPAACGSWREASSVHCY